MRNPERQRFLSTGRRVSVCTLALVIGFGLAIGAIPAPAQTFTVLHTFTGGRDGAYPEAGLTMDGAGNFYGTSFGGPPSQSMYGTVYKLTHRDSGWVVSPLYSFQGGSDGEYPRSKIVFGPDGTLYGVTLEGGGEAAAGRHRLRHGLQPAAAGHSLQERALSLDGNRPASLYGRVGRRGARVRDSRVRQRG